MKLYKYVKQKRIDVVCDRMICFTPPGYLNDPFECRLSFKTLTKDEQDEHIRSWRKWASIQYGILCLTKRPDSLVMWAGASEELTRTLSELVDNEQLCHVSLHKARLSLQAFGLDTGRFIKHRVFIIGPPFFSRNCMKQSL